MAELELWGRFKLLKDLITHLHFRLGGYVGGFIFQKRYLLDHVLILLLLGQGGDGGLTEGSLNLLSHLNFYIRFWMIWCTIGSIDSFSLHRYCGYHFREGIVLFLRAVDRALLC